MFDNCVPLKGHNKCYVPLNGIFIFVCRTNLYFLVKKYLTNAKNKVSADHLQGVHVPLVVRVPQVGNLWDSLYYICRENYFDTLDSFQV